MNDPVQVEQVAEIAKQVAELDVLNYAQAILAKDRPDLAEKIKSTMTMTTSSRMEMPIPETDIILNISLGQVGADYIADIILPPSAEEDLYKYISGMGSFATVYWRSWCLANEKLAAEIFRHDEIFKELKSDPPYRTSLYFDPTWPRRIGIMLYFTDKDGTLYAKRV